MKITQDFIPKGRVNRPGHSMTPKYITIHNTGNTSKDVNAAMHARYVKNQSTTASWHYTVDDGDTIYQHLPTNENGWHAGDGSSGIGNRRSIGIEICEYKGIDQNKANDNSIWLINKLMKEFTIELANIVPHQKWSGKYCPHNLLPNWSSFIEKIRVESGGGAMPTLRNGDTGPLVSQLQTDLNRIGYNLTVDGSFGSATERAVKNFQEKNKLVIDGIYGPATQVKLAEAIKPKPPETQYRLVTGTFKTKADAEKAAEAVRKQFGWVVYVKDE